MIQVRQLKPGIPMITSGEVSSRHAVSPWELSGAIDSIIDGLKKLQADGWTRIDEAEVVEEYGDYSIEIEAWRPATREEQTAYDDHIKSVKAKRAVTQEQHERKLLRSLLQKYGHIPEEEE